MIFSLRPVLLRQVGNASVMTSHGHLLRNQALPATIPTLRGEYSSQENLIRDQVP